MQKLLLFAFLATFVALPAQESHRIVTHPANPANDARPNNPAVPDVSALSSQLQRIVVLRFKYNTDLLAGLRKSIADQKIQNAVILSGFGSVRNYQAHQVANRDFPVKESWVHDPGAPADIIGMSGFVANGRVHPHVVLANQDHAFGGHLEPGTTVFTFAVVTLGILDDKVDLSKFDDWNYR
jgi:predicted DNA-binding protein with PD1-like motif